MIVSDLCRLVRAKNAGPFRVTVDCFCTDTSSYTQLVDKLDVDAVARVLGVDANDVKRFTLPELNVVKFGLERPIVQGSLGDRDLHGAQWAHVIASLSFDSGEHESRGASRRLATLTLLVKDYDEAIAWYTEKLGFTLIEDTSIQDKRWVVLAPGHGGARLLLARASDTEQEACIGHQTGGRVAFFLETDDFARDYKRYRDASVTFLEAPRIESYGSVAVFEDLYGNRWDLLQPN